ncbi:MAG: MFS transporter [Bowdeniella nasicola]|nr:MFS transporter [Bowdeniella nasicola]
MSNSNDPHPHNEAKVDEVVDPREKHRTLRKAALASFIGNFVEWFDYASYAYLASIIAVVFFPAEQDKATRLLTTFAIFALSFILRPIGGAVWGNWGDKYGRRSALSWSILMMTGATFCIGLIPPYAMIGIAAPILLLLLRMVQGFSASGEYAGAATFLAEYAPQSHRGLYTCLVPASTASGLLIGSLTVTFMHQVLSLESIHSWGWRIPFLLAGPLGWVGRYIRTHLEDSPVYQQMQDKVEAKIGKHTTLGYLFRNYWKEMLIAFSVASLNAVGFYMVLTYMPTYLREEVGFDDQLTFIAESITLTVYVLLIFSMGRLSDRFGRRTMLISACVAFIVLSVPLFTLLDHATFALVITVEIIFCVMLTANDGTLATFLAEVFPTEVRYTGFALSFNLANAIFGGTALYISTWLIEKTGSVLAPAWYLVGVSAMALVGMILAREHSHEALR